MRGGSGYIQDGSDALITPVTPRSFHPEPAELGNESSAELEAPVQLPTQTSRSSTESPESSHLFRRKFHSSCQREHYGIGPFALGELGRRGITDGSQHCAVRARMFRQQAKEPVVVPNTVLGRAQFQQGVGRRMGIGGQRLPDEGVRTSRELMQDGAVLLGTRQFEVVGRRMHGQWPLRIVGATILSSGLGHLCAGGASSYRNRPLDQLRHSP